MNKAPDVLELWPEGAPDTKHWSHQEQFEAATESFNLPIVRNVARPTVSVYLPDPERATGTGVVVAPGGAFHFLAIEHEGTQVAEWLTQRGIAAFLLRYRVTPTASGRETFLSEMRATRSDPQRREQVMGAAREYGIADGLQALRLVRRQAETWRVAPDRVGIMGFSAGGTVTVGAATRYDSDNRPAFAAPIYTAPLDGATPPADAPPLFLALAADDEMAVNASLPLFSAWRAAGKQAELHVYSRGGHGFGMHTKGLPSDQWIEQFGAWLAAEGF